VARRIGDDELAPLGREEPIGHVDGDALLTLGFEPVDEKREIDVFADCAVPDGISSKACQLVFEQKLRIVEQPADQGRLAIIDGAAGEEAQQAFRFLPAKIVGKGRRVEACSRHQK